MLLKNCKYVITQNKARDILENTDIEIESNKIKNIGKNLKSKTKDKTIDCSNKIVMPGLINTHTHIGMHSLRGICDDEELPNWLNKVVAAEKKFTPKQIQQNAEQACKEMLLSGTTTFVEMYTPLEPVIVGVKKHTIRAILCPVIYGFLGNVKEQLAAAKKLIDRFSHPLIQLGLGAHSIYTCDEQTLKDIKYYAHRKQLLTPIHLAETRKERFDCF
ncbi:MAG: amidohydrolase family protein, partial [Nanoarchaeota archaeon]